MIIIGKVINEIAKLEKSQQWAGIVLSDKLKSYNPSDRFVTNYSTPFKGNNKDMKVIDWINMKTIILTEQIKSIDFDKCFDSELEDVKEKKQNTIRFYNSMTQENTGPNSK